MENHLNLANASRIEVEEQLATGKSVVNNQYDSVDEVLGRIENRAAIKIKHLVFFRDAMTAGLKSAFFKFNRKVNSIHVQKLIKSLGNTDMFTLPCYVVPLRPILEKFPDIEVYDSDGNKVAPNTPDLDSYYAVYDGQHRIMACILSGNKDALLELNAFKGSDPLQRIKEINTTQKGWVGDDYLNSNMAVGKGDVKLYEESAKLQELHGITSTTANSILTFTKNTLRLKDVIEGKDTSKYVEENAQRGIGIFNAAMMRFDGAKNLQYIELAWPKEMEEKAVVTNIPIKKGEAKYKVAGKIIDHMRKGKTVKFGTKEIDTTEAVFYINKVSDIVKIAQKNKLKPEEVNILCSKSSEDKLKKAGLALGSIPKEGDPHKMFTFATKSVYLGVDFYSKCAFSYIFADPSQTTLALDIYTDLSQILGRQRLEENPYHNEAILFMKENSIGFDENEFTDYIEKKKKATDALIENFKTSKIRRSGTALSRSSGPAWNMTAIRVIT